MEDKEILFEQYKLAVEMADRVSSRREGANKIFLSANSIIFAFLATQKEFSVVHILITVSWKVYSDEWQKLKNGKDKKVHSKLTAVEKKLPWLFLGFYALLFLYVIFSMFS